MEQTKKKTPLIIGAIVAVLIIAAAAYYFLVYRTGLRNDITKQADVVPVTEIEQYIELKDYKGVEISKIDTTITDEQVEANIQNVLAGQTTFEEVDRAAAEGDVVNIDYVGKIDGTEFAGGSAQGFNLELGSGTFIEGFESGLIGKKKGETVDVTTTFPDPYQNPELAGKEAIFTVTINAVQVKKEAQLNDELVAKVSQSAKTVEEYKAEVRKNLEESFRQNAENQQKAELWSKIQQKVTVKKLPEEKITELISQMWTRFEENAKAAGMTKEDAIKASNTTAEEMEKQLKAQAELVLKDQLAVEYISAKEKIVLSDKEYQEGAQKYVTSTGVADVAALEQTYGKHDIALSLLYDKVLTELVKQAKLVDPTDAVKTFNEGSESKTDSTGSKTDSTGSKTE